MIQRIQTLFLLIAALSFVALFKLPFATSTAKIGEIFSDGIYNLNDHTLLLGLTVLGILIALGNIFLFKNRPLQMRLSYLLVVVAVCLGALSLMYFMGATKDMQANQEVHDKAGLYMPIIGVVFGILASVFIRKDENLVRSSDRLR
ncbi:MAG: DUF4293 domain-containing protein [Bacteroidota bacterium]